MNENPIYRLLDLGRTSEALARLESMLSTPLPSDLLEGLQARAFLGACCVEVGAAVPRVDLIEKGIGFFLEVVANGHPALDRAELEYNLGNGWKSLYDLGRNSATTPYSAAVVEPLIRAKNHYWKATRLSATPTPELAVNLGNSLDSCARVVEAFWWYEKALAVRPGFSMALVNRAIAFDTLVGLSDQTSISMMVAARKMLESALQSGDLRLHVRQDAVARLERVNRSLERLSWEGENSEDVRLHEAEQRAHSPFRRFCINERLTLSEHALYCDCVGARRDELSVLKSSSPIAGEFVPRMELVLNRLKAEFSLARSLAYQGLMAEREPSWNTEGMESTFTELADFEAPGLRVEFLRTSFRLCFGLLDKIARAICDQFQLAHQDENIYFESFWKKPRSKAVSGEDRWETIQRIENWGVVALYSLATEFTQEDGQLGNAKARRNALEHGLLVVSSDSDRTEAFLRDNRIQAIDVVRLPDFELALMELLRATAAAIFSFAFAIRIEGVKTSGDFGTPRVIGKKLGFGPD